MVILFMVALSVGAPAVQFPWWVWIWAVIYHLGETYYQRKLAEVVIAGATRKR